ncbi:galactoside alpha-(1,2)-fucosyltransferase 1-like [Neocloeon triangulifer]|uniref:galactoside alpha-(1,2)-fucosyltransferase 1-like n=1 Tax=Neocloeon triangulifer TaxID=2078957 RepID=UPI00286F0BFC|nr:galactoside alpha-(1,2)-fucosyltransferase 1-like [Neocloeon triangulifer]
MEPPVQRSQLFPLETLDLRFKGRNILIPVYSILLELIVHQRDAFRREFRFNDKIMRNVDKTIQSLGGAGKTLIGVHVRRTDFKNYLPKAFKTHLVAASYFKKAMQWYRNEISGPLLFLIVTDDVDWCRQHLLGRGDVKIATKKPAHDLALMGVCNHTIIDYGTFGYSGAFFSKGHSISLDVDKLFAETMAKEAAWTIFSIQNLKEVKFESAKKLKKPVS